ncbi:hypothetical protein B1R94_06035 [Mycolicibacterium litorale]|nr:hypothetical protein B1R94_06035 [Mycolicibacterium litorale]
MSTSCLLGSGYCTTRPGAGVIAMLQPCALDRSPAGRARWIGPITDDGDVADVCDWIVRGKWSSGALPARLRHPLAQLSYASRRN